MDALINMFELAKDLQEQLWSAILMTWILLILSGASALHLHAFYADLLPYQHFWPALPLLEKIQLAAWVPVLGIGVLWYVWGVVRALTNRYFEPHRPLPCPNGFPTRSPAWCDDTCARTATSCVEPSYGMEPHDDPHAASGTLRGADRPAFVRGQRRTNLRQWPGFGRHVHLGPVTTKLQKVPNFKF